ncbi:myomodulin neuropeptides 2-like [Gigantopelta aegis]|uniref:myomodulin neuropeptides 2-like n=1 Tax=Gigantopelta aegis TaxID=1735272 RepID=UPI001B888493|nr:myomodulin neuropeptides 2-like [Gigantopelta aegis]
MKNFYHILGFGLILLVHSGSLSPTNDDEEAENDDGEVPRVKRGAWSMLRLGRGLQMLRLGKRQLPMMRLGRQTLTDAELHSYFASLLDGKKLGERQVPMPRYGRDMDWQSGYKKDEDEDEDDQLVKRLDLDVQLNNDGYPHIRPSPRGGKVRFRRSLKSRLTKLSQEAAKLARLSDSYSFSDGQKERAVALPRIGRLSKERAVPAPRIG